MVAALKTTAPCAHPRCRRAAEGSCLIKELLALLESEARSLGADRVQVTDTGRHVQFGVRFTDALECDWAAYRFRDFATLKVAEVGLDYLAPSLRRYNAGAAVTVHLIDSADEIGVRS